MTVTHRPGSAVHEPSAPPDPKALFSRLAAFSARHRRGVIVVVAARRVRRRAARADARRARCRARAGRRRDRPRRQVRDEIRRDFPQLGAEDPVVVYHQATTIASDPAPLTAARRPAAAVAASARAVANPLDAAGRGRAHLARRPHRARSRRPDREQGRRPSGRGRRARQLRRAS